MNVDKGKEEDLPGENHGGVLGNVFVSTEIFVHMTSWVIVIRNQRERPPRKDILTDMK